MPPLFENPRFYTMFDISVPYTNILERWNKIDDRDKYITPRLKKMEESNLPLYHFILQGSVGIMENSASPDDIENIEKAGTYVVSAIFTLETMQRVPTLMGRQITQADTDWMEAAYKLNPDFIDLLARTQQAITPNLYEAMRRIVAAEEVHKDALLAGHLEMWVLSIHAGARTSGMHL